MNTFVPNAGGAQARDYLNRVHRMERKLRWKREQITALRDMAASATMRISDMPRTDSPNLQRMETLVCKVADLEQEVLAEVVALEATRIDTALMICNLPNEQHQQLLTERYLRGRGWKEIADAMGYSLSHMFRLHEDALCHMEVLLAKEGARL